MRPGTYDLDLYRGDTYSWRFTLWKDPLKLEAADLTGVTAKSEIRPSSGTTPIVDMACTITQPNIIDVRLEVADWSGWALTAGAWDLQLTYSDGSVITIVAGKVKVTPDITDSSPAVTSGANVLVSAVGG